MLLLTLLLVACGEGDVAVRGDEDVEVLDGAWWLLEAAGFSLSDGGLVDQAIADSTGHLWRLEYTDSRQTLQLAAHRADSGIVEMTQRHPEVGSATLGELAVTLRRGPGVPDDDIPPSVGAEWMVGDVFLTFGGGNLTEADLRQHLSGLRQVPRAEWDAAVQPESGLEPSDALRSSGQDDRGGPG